MEEVDEDLYQLVVISGDFEGVGDIDLDDALTSREVINSQLRDILDEATDVVWSRFGRGDVQRS